MSFGSVQEVRGVRGVLRAAPVGAAMSGDPRRVSVPLAKQDLRDLATVERLAQSVLRQCEYLRRNGGSDTIRWGLIAGEAWKAWRCAAKADRRAARENDWMVFRWFMPRGYGA